VRPYASQASSQDVIAQKGQVLVLALRGILPQPLLRLEMRCHAFKACGKIQQIALDIRQAGLRRQLSELFGSLAVQLGCRLFRVAHWHSANKRLGTRRYNDITCTRPERSRPVTPDPNFA
jgi:hypothetical protein